MNKKGLSPIITVLIAFSIFVFIVACMANLDSQRHERLMTQPTTIGESIQGIYPVQDLGDGWWLVEIRQEYEADNPLPIGPKKVKILVPHMLRLPATEMERLIEIQNSNSL